MQTPSSRDPFVLITRRLAKTMRAFQLQFNDHFLNPEFVTGISASCCDRLLYINLLGSKHLRACMLFPMDEETRFRFVGLQDAFLDTVQAIYDTHILANKPDHRQTNEAILLQTLQEIIALKADLEKKSALAALNPTPAFVMMVGPWAHEDMFFAVQSTAVMQ